MFDRQGLFEQIESAAAGTWYFLKQKRPVGVHDERSICIFASKEIDTND